MIRVAECAYKTVISSKMDKNVCHREQGYQSTYSGYRVKKVLYQIVIYKGKPRDQLSRQILNTDRKAFHKGLKIEKRSRPL